MSTINPAHTFRADLSARVQWFKPFEENFESRVIQAIRQRPLPLVDYDPLSIDRLLRDAVSLVEHCLVYRKDGMELDVLTIRAAAEYAKFLQTAPIDEKSQILLRCGTSRSRH